MRRTFVVGCPRSGTTIVQSMLARHPAVYTLPETAFFERLHGNLAYRWGDVGAEPRRLRWRQKLGLTQRHMRDLLAVLHVQLSGRSHREAPSWFQDVLARQFMDLLDRTAAEAGRDMWLEKTPNHLLYITEIASVAPDARFVHVVRRGEDVLASLMDVHLRFENDAAFGGGAVHWARRWNRAVAIHRQFAGHPDHHVVFLEDMVRQPDLEWARLCAFLDISASVSLDDANQQAVANLDEEPWKQSAIGGQLRPADPKVDGLFGPRMQAWLAEHLASYHDLRSLCRAQPVRVVPRPRLVDDCPLAEAG